MKDKKTIKIKAKGYINQLSIYNINSIINFISFLIF
jgi:hypothetical protein